MTQNPHPNEKPPFQLLTGIPNSDPKPQPRCPSRTPHPDLPGNRHLPERPVLTRNHHSGSNPGKPPRPRAPPPTWESNWDSRPPPTQRSAVADRGRDLGAEPAPARPARPAASLPRRQRGGLPAQTQIAAPTRTRTTTWTRIPPANSRLHSGRLPGPRSGNPEPRNQNVGPKRIPDDAGPRDWTAASWGGGSGPRLRSRDSEPQGGPRI